MEAGLFPTQTQQGILKNRQDSLQQGQQGGVSIQTSDHLLFAPYVKREPTPPSTPVSPKCLQYKTVNFALQPTVLSFAERPPCQRLSLNQQFLSEAPALSSPLRHRIMTMHRGAELATKQDIPRMRFRSSARSAYSCEMTMSPRSCGRRAPSVVDDCDVSAGFRGNIPPELHPLRMVRRRLEPNTRADFRLVERKPLQLVNTVNGALRSEQTASLRRQKPDRLSVSFKQEDDRSALSPLVEMQMNQLGNARRSPHLKWGKVLTWEPCKVDKQADDRGKIIQAPKYSMGVLEENWQYRSDESVKAPLPKFKGCTIYQTSYKALPAECYKLRNSLDTWGNRGKMEGLPNDMIFPYDEKECLNNFLTTTDLAYRIIPQICPKMREFNTNTFEWVPSQDYLPCHGNLTHFGLTEWKRREWEAERVDPDEVSYLTTMRDHFQWPNSDDIRYPAARAPVDCQIEGSEDERWHCPLPIVPNLPSGPGYRYTVEPEAS